MRGYMAVTAIGIEEFIWPWWSLDQQIKKNLIPGYGRP